MRLIKHQNAASSSITVTATATNLFSLMDTAGSVTNSKNYFLAPGRAANGVIIAPENGDIRVLNGVDPTSSAGFLCKQGSKYCFSGTGIDDLRLIRTSGDVTCSVMLFNGESGEGFTSVSDNPTISVTLPNEGQQTMANSISVAIASNQSPVPVVQTPGTATHTTTESIVGDSASSVTILAANTARTGATFRNGSTSPMYIAKGATAATTSPVRLLQNEIYELPILAGGEVYRGIVTGIWDSDAGGSVYVEESV